MSGGRQVAIFDRLDFKKIQKQLKKKSNFVPHPPINKKIQISMCCNSN
jgi:hypothetical protein